jgi:hypothetical protein
MGVLSRIISFNDTMSFQTILDSKYSGTPLYESDNSTYAAELSENF